MDRADDAEYVEFVAATRGECFRRTAYLLTGDWHRAEDATQDALVKLYAVWTRLNQSSSAVAYTRKILVRTVIDETRRPWRRETPADPPDRAGADGALPQLEARLVLREALRTLPSSRRACVVLRYFNDLSVAETATVLGCSEGNVKSQTSRALRDLKTYLSNAGIAGYDVLEGARL